MWKVRVYFIIHLEIKTTRDKIDMIYQISRYTFVLILNWSIYSAFSVRKYSESYFKRTIRRLNKKIIYSGYFSKLYSRLRYFKIHTVMMWCCDIESFVLSRCFLDFSVGVGAFVIGLSQISSFFSFVCTLDHQRQQGRNSHWYVSIKNLLRVWHVGRENLLPRTPGAIAYGLPFETFKICRNFRTLNFQNPSLLLYIFDTYVCSDIATNVDKTSVEKIERYDAIIWKTSLNVRQCVVKVTRRRYKMFDYILITGRLRTVRLSRIIAGTSEH